MSATVAPARLPTPSRARLIALRVLAIAHAILIGLASFGLPSLITAWSTTGDELPLRTAYIVWGVLGGMVVPSLVLGLLWRRTAVAACLGLMGVVAGCVIVLVVGYKPEHLVYLASVAVPAVILLGLHPQTSKAFRPQSAIDRPAIAIVAVMAVPAAWYGIDMALTSRATHILDTPSGEFTMHGQYAQAAGLAFALILLASVGTLRRPGRPFLVALTTTAAALMGIAGILFPHDPMSMGTSWGVATLTASAAYAILTVRQLSTDRVARNGKAPNPPAVQRLGSE